MRLELFANKDVPRAVLGDRRIKQILVDGKPFPTLYWLIDAELSLKIDRLEAAGWIARVQSEVATNGGFRLRMQQDHAAHIALRESFLTYEERDALASKGMLSALSERGIGGGPVSRSICPTKTFTTARITT